MEEKLTKFLNSDEFINSVSNFDFNDNNTFNLISLLINYSITYSIIFPNSNNINNMIKELANFLSENDYNINSFIAAQVITEYCNTFKVNRNEAEINKHGVLEYIYNQIALSGCFFHGFNSSFYSNIEKNGLNTNERLWDNEELLKLEEIFEKHEIKNSIGFVFKNCQSTLYFSNRPVFSYHYASSSPEWFSIFCGEVGNISNTNRLAYKKRDYNKALENISNKMNNSNFSKEDQKFVLTMFKKYWFQFGGGHPMIAIAKNIFKFGRPMYAGEFDNCFLNVGISRILNDSSLNDIKYSENIDFNNLSFIELPRYDEIINKVENINKNKTKVKTK